MKNAKKITSILMVASMTMVLLVGCGSTKTDTTTNTNTNATNSQTRKSDPTAIKTLYSDTLKSLVTDGTITQAQSDQVLEAVTKNVPQDTETGKSAGTDKSSGTDKSTGTKPKNNRLSELVTSGVITQAQADTINQKVGEAMKSNQSSKSK
jgi:competence protein ComGC